MKNRNWLIIAAGACLFYALVFPRYFSFWVNYGETDVWAPVFVAITCVVCWTAIEVTNAVVSRRPLRCACGYALSGVKCPECGQPVGGDR